MKKFFVWAGMGIAALVLVVGVGLAWASSSANAKLSRTYSAHEVYFPVPMPLGDEAIAEGEDPDTVALERAIARGEHLISARYACVDCHGANFGGGVMVDDPAMGSLLGPNLTRGAGSATRDYTVADWDRIVRHGIRKDGRPALMPSEDFMAMSDQELSDIIAYIRSLPPVDNAVPASTLGPVGKVLVATGRFTLSAHLIEAEGRPHPVLPPASEESVEFGGHLAMVCTGCHRQTFEGGPIVQGPPDWAPAANLTPHADGLGSYTYEAFEKVMRQGIRPNGEPVKMPMTIATTYASKMTETEMKALWVYLRSLPPISNGSR